MKENLKSKNHLKSLLKSQSVSQSRIRIKSIALTIGLILISYSALYQAPAKTTNTNSQIKTQVNSLPGIFIADIDGRWQIPSQGENGKLLGGIVCKGGYIGSPLIPQDDTLIKRFLNECESGQRAGTGRLPIIDSPANHDDNSAGYQAYKAILSGQTYYLCRGFLNSTDWCSFEAEKKAAQMVSSLDRPAIMPQIAYPGNIGSGNTNNIISQSIISQPQRIELTPIGSNSLENVPKTLPSEVAQEISNALGEKASGMSIPNLTGATLVPVSPSSPNTSSSNLGSLDSSTNSPRAIQVTKEEIQALQSGQITLAQLSQNRPTVNLNGQNELPNPNSLLQNSISNPMNIGLPSKAIGITEQDLQLLRSGQITLEQLVANRPVVDLMSNQTNQNMDQNLGQNSNNPNLSNSNLAYNSQSSSLNLPSESVSGSMPRPRYANEDKTNNPDEMVEMIGATREDLEALKAGKVSLEDLVEIRPLMAIKQKNLPKLPSSAKNLSPKAAPILAGLYAPINNPILQEAQSEIDRLYAYCGQYSPYAYNQASAYAANYAGSYNYPGDYSNMAYQDMAYQNTGYQDNYMPQTPHSVWW